MFRYFVAADWIFADPILERDDNEAIDEGNIVEGRTRHAKPEAGSYREPGDEEGLPTDD